MNHKYTWLSYSRTNKGSTCLRTTEVWESVTTTAQEPQPIFRDLPYLVWQLPMKYLPRNFIALCPAHNYKKEELKQVIWRLVLHVTKEASLAAVTKCMPFSFLRVSAVRPPFWILRVHSWQDEFFSLIQNVFEASRRCSKVLGNTVFFLPPLCVSPVADMAVLSLQEASFIAKEWGRMHTENFMKCATLQCANTPTHHSNVCRT